LEDLRVDCKVILEWTLGKYGGTVWTGLDSSGSGQVPVAGSCGHGNEPPNSIKGE